MNPTALILLKLKNPPHLRDTSNDEVSHFGVIPRPDCTNANELVNPFDGPSNRRYHGVLIDKRPMATALGLNFNVMPTTKLRGGGRTA